MKYDAFDLTLIAVIGVLAFVVMVSFTLKVLTPHPKPLQNIVCDTSYGVQYFEHKGYLTLRVNHEGKPIRCD